MTKKVDSFHYNRSKGGMFSFINISKINMGSDEFCSTLLNIKKVACTPGIIFGASWDDHIRISLGGDIKEFAVAMQKIAEFVEDVSE